MAELVDALVSNTCGKPCRFDSGAGYKAGNFQPLITWLLGVCFFLNLAKTTYFLSYGFFIIIQLSINQCINLFVIQPRFKRSSGNFWTLFLTFLVVENSSSSIFVIMISAMISANMIKVAFSWSVSSTEVYLQFFWPFLIFSSVPNKVLKKVMH